MTSSTSKRPSKDQTESTRTNPTERSLLSSGINADQARQIANALRFLSMDAVQKANSGHPGAPMGLADVATAIWQKLRFDPSDPTWIARDRFVLSCGHASALLYSLIHLWGGAIKRADLESFRQLESLTPGHPEVGHTPGVEMTTGPLGQGCATSVGFALGAERLSRQLMEAGGGPDHPLRGQKTVTLCSDGDLMEGISYEAASIAGHLELGDLIWFYDDNRISIDGETSLSFSEDVASRFLAMGWRVTKVDGHDPVQLSETVDRAWESDGRPTLVICRTHIGYGSPNKVDSNTSHGSPLGAGEIELTRAALGWTSKPFSVPQSLRSLMKRQAQRKTAEVEAWSERFEAWGESHPVSYQLLSDLFAHPELTVDQLEDLLSGEIPSAGATRKLSNQALKRIVQHSPTLLGGSADLSGSNGLSFDEPSFGSRRRHPSLSPYGRIVHFGVREHAMAAITNGVTLFGSARGFCGTFLVFSDYLRPAIRLAALSEIASVFVLTHDSVFLGEDGPTHQPVEHAWALRLIPNVIDFRPATGAEVSAAWTWALTQDVHPVVMMLTRQDLPELPLEEEVGFEEIERGAYVVCTYTQEDVLSDEELGGVEELELTEEAEEAEEAEEFELVEEAEEALTQEELLELLEDLISDELDCVTLVGTGSEVALCVEVAQRLHQEGYAARVVSMPSVNLFLTQPVEWRESILGFGPRVSVEAGSTLPWRGIIGSGALCVGVDSFGASAPMRDLAEHFELTPELVTDRVMAWLDELEY